MLPLRPLLPLLLSALATVAQADEAAIRKTLAQRFPQMPKADEITKTPIPGLYEVRIDKEVFYADETGAHIIQGNIIETRTRTDLTAARVDKLMAIPFASLPLADAVVIKQGTGARRIAVFADPNCGYCKRFEKDLMGLKDVTIYTFLYPILGPDSNVKSRQIWCSKESGEVWRDWMVNGKAPLVAMGACDDKALARNVELGRKHRVNGTPAIVFEDGTRAAGALPAAQVEARMKAAKS